MKKAAVVIVTYNASKYIEGLFKSLERQNYPKDGFRIFVIDNASTDGTVKEIQKFNPKGFLRENSEIRDLNVEIVENNKNLGFAGGNNVGMKRVLEWGADYIVLLNQDMEVDEDWLGELIKRVESDNKLGVVQSMMMLSRDKDKINSTGERLNYLGIGYSGNYQSSITVRPRAPVQGLERHGQVVSYQSRNNIISYASGAAVLFKSDVLKSIGLFDESFFMYHEDSDLGWRARLAGWNIALARESVCYHDYQFKKNKKVFYWTEKNRLAFLAKNFEVRTLILIFPMFLIMEVGMLGYALAGGWFGQKIKSYWWVLQNIKSILKSRKKVQSLRKVKDRELKKYLIAGIEFGGLENPVLKYLTNPMLKLYWVLIKRFI